MGPSPQSIPPTPSTSTPLPSPQTLLGVNSFDDTTAITKHSSLCFDIVTFKVENVIFKIPKHSLRRHSAVFNDMFCMGPENGQVEGTSEDNPIVLEGVSSRDFAALMKVLYPVYGEDLKLTTAEWHGVLQLSTKWLFHSIRSVAIERLSELLAPHPFQRLAMVKPFDLEEWKLPAMEQIITRARPLNLEEISQLEPTMLMAIINVREYWYAQTGLRQYGNRGLTGDVKADLKKILDEVDDLHPM